MRDKFLLLPLSTLALTLLGWASVPAVFAQGASPSPQTWGPDPNPYMTGGPSVGGYPERAVNGQPAAPPPYVPYTPSYGPAEPPAGAAASAPFLNPAQTAPGQPFYPPPLPPAYYQMTPGQAPAGVSGQSQPAAGSAGTGVQEPSSAPYAAGQQSFQQPVSPPAGGAPSELSQVRQLVRAGKSSQALPAAVQLVQQRPDEPEGYFWLGVILDNINRNEDSLRSFQRCLSATLKSGMDSAELRMNLGNELMKLGRLDDAVEQYKRGKAVDPELALVELNLGRAYIEKGDVDAALKCFQRCEDLHFQPAQLSYYRAKALRKAGKVDDATNQLNLALTKGPSAEATRRIKSEFSDLLH